MQLTRALESKQRTHLHFDLADPYMTLLHRAGLAGLYMTLKQLEKEQVQTIGGLSWELTDRSVSLSWDGNDFEVLDWLFKESFQISDGVIALRGLDAKTMDIQALVSIHQVIRFTILQLPKLSNLAWGNSIEKSIEIDEKPFMVTYKELLQYPHQSCATVLCDSQGKLLKDKIPVKSWLYPGATTKHSFAEKETSFYWLPEELIILAYAVVGCFYFQLKSRLHNLNSKYALVIPEVTNLEIYSRYRKDSGLRNLSYKDFYASSSGDAGLKFLTLCIDTLREFSISKCQVVSFGKHTKKDKQVIRTNSYLVAINQEIYTNYEVCKSCFNDCIVVDEKKNTSWIDPSFAREIIADNLARGKPWFAGLSEKINSGELFKQLTYEREGLHMMVKSPNLQWSDRERLFVQSCHEAISGTYAQLAKRTKEGEQIRFDKVNEKFRTGLGRCKSPSTFREFITDFWARAGYVPTLKEHWDELMDLVMTDWKSARDLALLALASYKGKGSEQEKQPDESEQDDSLGMIDHYDDEAEEED